MAGLICVGCGQLNHVGLAHICDRPGTEERIRRVARAERVGSRMRQVMDDLAAHYAAQAQAFVGVNYTVIPEPPANADPIRVQAYVGYPLAQIETCHAETIEGELA